MDLASDAVAPAEIIPLRDTLIQPPFVRKVELAARSERPHQR